MAVMAAGLVACSSVNSNAAVQVAPAAAEAAQPAGTVTFIEFYAEW